MDSIAPSLLSLAIALCAVVSVAIAFAMRRHSLPIKEDTPDEVQTANPVIHEQEDQEPESVDLPVKSIDVEPTVSSETTTEASGSSEEDEGEDHATEALAVPLVPPVVLAPTPAFKSSLLASIAAEEAAASAEKKPRRRRRTRSRKPSLEASAKRAKPSSRRPRYRAKQSTAAVEAAAM